MVRRAAPLAVVSTRVVTIVQPCTSRSGGASGAEALMRSFASSALLGADTRALFIAALAMAPEFVLAVKVMDKNVNGALVFVRSVWTEFLILLEGKITLFEIVLLNLVRRLKVDAVGRMLGVKSFFLYYLLMAKKSLEACWTGFCASALNLKSEVVEYLRIREILESVRTPIESLMGYSLGFGVGLLGVAIFYEDGPERVLNLYYSIFGGPK